MNKNEMKRKFYKVVDTIDNCCDTIIYNEHGVTIEKGLMLKDDYFITYGLEDNLIKLYAGDKELLQFNDESPILSMFEEVINLIYEN
ncbi:hypothetical protein [Clostridium tetani]|uniref:hypothetical protein n=1 Tax=Clostridium tetani TaxID=1513 RepID=UPI0024A7C79C|nr:hypothetical protein [Clostridium tetani]